MKFRFILVLLVILSLGLSACGGGGDDSDPSKPLEDFFDAFAKMDGEKAADTVCNEHRDDVNAGLDMLFGFMALGDEEAKVEIIDMKLEVTDETDGEAMVTVSGGKIKITIQGETQEQDISETAEAVRVIKEDGKWLLCDDAFAEGFGP